MSSLSWLKKHMILIILVCSLFKPVNMRSHNFRNGVTWSYTEYKAHSSCFHYSCNSRTNELLEHQKLIKPNDFPATWNIQFSLIISVESNSIFCRREIWSFITRLFKSFEFGNGSRMSEENLVTLEFKYLQNEKW